MSSDNLISASMVLLIYSSSKSIIIYLSLIRKTQGLFPYPPFTVKRKLNKPSAPQPQIQFLI